ncbi:MULTISPECIES: hypothetical protein [unclassified Nocardia]|uniref:hypothetical protein n=1 Tax=unclassified Nocardia TaxID=2637762 RepID=UPI002107D8A9|nr:MULTISPECIES: hypothetical protein [unclassified Nocardia]
MSDMVNKDDATDSATDMSTHGASAKSGSAAGEAEMPPQSAAEAGPATASEPGVPAESASVAADSAVVVRPVTKSQPAAESEPAVVAAAAKPAVAAADPAVQANSASDVDPVAGAEPGAERKGFHRLITRPQFGRRTRIASGAAAALLLVASLGSTGYLFFQNKKHEDLLSAQEQARAAACRYAPVLADYDAKHLDGYVSAVLDGATGDWRKQFDSTSKELRDVLAQGEVVSKVNEVQCAIRGGDTNSAEAIVVIGQTITSLGTKGKPAPGQLSMVMRLERSGDRWLVNKVDAPLAPRPQQ